MAEPLPAFVARRQGEWEKLRGLLEAQRAGKLRLTDLEVLDRLYRRASADLARAQSQYPGTDVDRFLNQLCGEAYGRIYRPVGMRGAALWDFFRRGFPRALRAELPYVGVSAALLALGLLAGALVVLLEPGGAQLLVDQNLRQTIADRHMWTDDLLSVMPPGVAASAILTNNLSVAIAAFALGATAGIGTVLLLLSNGLHVGAVAALCFTHDMGWPFLSFVAAHGVVELSIIVIAGASGLMVGHALVEPGELPRGVHVRRRAGQAVRLLLGCAPFLALVGVVEGYISPGELFPGGLKICLGLSLGAAFWLYLFRGGRERATPPAR